MKKKHIGIIIGVLILVLGFVVISLNSKTIDYKEKSVDDWYNDIISGKEVVTIYGLSTCAHCQEYYPVISKLADKYNINLYFFELDTESEKDSDAYDKLMESFDLVDYEDSVPFTYIMRDGKYVGAKTGYASRENTIQFLKEYEIIKD